MGTNKIILEGPIIGTCAENEYEPEAKIVDAGIKFYCYIPQEIDNYLEGDMVHIEGTVFTPREIRVTSIRRM